MRILVKLGGAQLEQPAPRAEIAQALASARAAGHELVLVHGGGNQIRALTQRLGIRDRYHEGLRVTDAATAEVVLMVLAGLVNRELVEALRQAGLSAVGLTGADAGLFGARKYAAADLGYVGEVDEVEPRIALELLAAGHVPVIATVAPLSARAAAGGAPREHFYNINADMAVGPLARALNAQAVLFLTDVPGVLGADQQRIPALDAARCAELRKSGVIAGGMLPKVESALAAAAAAPGARVKIAPAAGREAVLAALGDSVGTAFESALIGARG